MISEPPDIPAAEFDLFIKSRVDQLAATIEPWIREEDQNRANDRPILINGRRFESAREAAYIFRIGERTLREHAGRPARTFRTAKGFVKLTVRWAE